MYFNYFILPFALGLLILLAIVFVRFSVWIGSLSRLEHKRILKNIFTTKTLSAIKESFVEGLLHRKIFKTNPVLGYMHMSLAFGWFLLIVVGHIEAFVHFNSVLVSSHIPIFYRFFITDDHSTFFPFLMDLLLLMVLSGVALAYFKRFNKKAFGMKKTTKLKAHDYIALSFLWFIFPLRFLAESFSAGIHHNGSFLTQTAGNFFANFLPLDTLALPTWWAYSFALGGFFVALPTSRYMHIPTEILFIFLKNYGIKLKKSYNAYSRVQVNSCSRCGICINKCPLLDANITTTQSVYMLTKLRKNDLSDETLFNCLLCGQCQNACPVDIGFNDIRTSRRILTTKEYNSTYDYLENKIHEKADVIYFAGCMTHLTPAIKKSMVDIFNHVGANYWFMDEHEAACCGRPLMTAGQNQAAQKLIIQNQQDILASGAKTLVLSCPICYKTFNEDYNLGDIRILHHSEYILDLINANKLPINQTFTSAIYHDPCELGRGSGIYEQPREVLKNYVNLVEPNREKEDAFCCGGSLSNIKIQMNERNDIRDKVLDNYAKTPSDLLITACPLCKKTFTKGKDIEVKDIAEVVAMDLN